MTDTYTIIVKNNLFSGSSSSYNGKTYKNAIRIENESSPYYGGFRVTDDTTEIIFMKTELSHIAPNKTVKSKTNKKSQIKIDKRDILVDKNILEHIALCSDCGSGNSEYTSGRIQSMAREILQLREQIENGAEYLAGKDI